MESITPKIRAHKKLSTLNPGTSLVTKIIKIALRIKVKRPSVKIFIGKVRIRRTGFKNAFIIPKTKATTIADVKFAT